MSGAIPPARAEANAEVPLHSLRTGVTGGARTHDLWGHNPALSAKLSYGHVAGWFLFSPRKLAVARQVSLRPYRGRNPGVTPEDDPRPDAGKERRGAGFGAASCTGASSDSRSSTISSHSSSNRSSL